MLSASLGILFFGEPSFKAKSGQDASGSGRLARARLARRRCVIVVSGSVVAQPDAWASLGLFLRRVVLHETTSIEPQRTLPTGPMTLDQAQCLVP